MQKNIIAAFLLFFSSSMHAEDLLINMRGVTSTSYMNTRVKIENKGIANTIKYSSADEAIIGASNGARISIVEVPFGEKNLGNFGGITVEYSLTDQTQGGHFDFCLNNSSFIIATLPVVNTGNGYAKGVVWFDTNLVGKNNLCMTWVGHGASVKSIAIMENTPVSSIKVAATNGAYVLSSGAMAGVSGIHRVKLVWRNNTANVKSVYFDGPNLSSNEVLRINPLVIYSKDNNVTIRSEDLLKTVSIYDLTGKVVTQLECSSTEINQRLCKGAYIVSTKTLSGQTQNSKLLVN